MVDLLILNGKIVTMDAEERILEDGAIAIEDDRIVDLGESRELKRRYSADTEIDATGKVVLPGLVNTHTHFFQNLQKGMRDDLALEEWVNEVQMPHVRLEFKNFLAGNHKLGYHAALLGCIEALKSGTTCIVDMDIKNPLVPEAFRCTGIRAFYAISLADQWIPREVLLPKEETMKIFNQITRKWHGSENGRIQCMYGPSTPYICSRDFLQEIRSSADESGMLIHIHVSETKHERDLIKKQTGKLPVEYLYDLGFLGSDVSAVHCVWVSKREINLLKKTRTKVLHCPESNMKLGSGVAPIPTMLREGVPVSLATDGCACNDNLDMFEAMKTAAFLHKISKREASILSAHDVLRMATIEGARTLRLETGVGSLETGKKADIILIDLDKARLRPLHDIINTLVYCANGGDVDTVIVDGRIVVKNSTIVTVDEINAIQEAEKEMLRNLRS